MCAIIKYIFKNSHIFLFQNVVGLLIADKLCESVALNVLWYQMLTG